MTNAALLIDVLGVRTLWRKTGRQAVENVFKSFAGLVRLAVRLTTEPSDIIWGGASNPIQHLLSAKILKPQFALEENVIAQLSEWEGGCP